MPVPEPPPRPAVPAVPPPARRCPVCGSTAPLTPARRCPSCGLLPLRPQVDEESTRSRRRWRVVAVALAPALVAGLVGVVASAVARDPVPGLATGWRVRLDASLVAPAAVEGASMYVATRVGTVIGVGLAQGRPRWRLETTEAAVAGPAAGGGLVYVATERPAGGGGHVFAVDAGTGEERWRYTTTAVPSGPPVPGDDRLHVATAGEVVALDSRTGEERWRYPVAGVTGIAAGEGVVIVATPGRLVALDATNGQERWAEAADGGGGGPAVARELAVTGGLAVAVQHETVVAQRLADGARRWAAAPGGAVRDVAVAGSAIVVLLGNGGVASLDRDSGEEVWRWETGTRNGLRIATDGTRVAVAGDELVVLDAASGDRLGAAGIGADQGQLLAVAGGQVLLGGGTALEARAPE